jgi:hypothetical protein
VLQGEKDSLMLTVSNLVDVMNSIDSANALAGYKAPKNGKGEPVRPDEIQIRDRTLKALARLRVVETRLKNSVAKVSKLSNQNGELSAQLAQFRQTADALQLQVGTQQARVDTLMQQLAMANALNDSLSTSNRQLATTVDSFSTVARRGFVVSGSKDYLLAHSIVNEVGGSRFPFIVKIGSTLRPASAHLDTALFKPVDRVADHLIALDSTKRYEVISAQDLDGADRSNADGRVFYGSIHIVDPQRFWHPSSFLILREL